MTEEVQVRCISPNGNKNLISTVIRLMGRGGQFHFPSKEIPQKTISMVIRSSQHSFRLSRLANAYNHRPSPTSAC